MKISTLGRISLLMLLILSLNACQRNSSGGNARITFKMPQEIEQKQATSINSAQLHHVVVQATASDLTEKIHVIYSSDERTIPSELSLEIPSGDGRLIQLLAVYAQPNNDQKMIYYGDVSVSLKGATATIDIPIQRLGTGTYDKNSELAGRFLDSTTTGPNGVLQVVYKPTGKPSLLIKKEFMFGGWFSSFIFDEIPLDYVLPDSSIWMSQVTSATLNASSQVIKVYTPDYQKLSWTSGAEVFEPEEGEAKIIGFFAKDTSFLADKKICVKAMTPQNDGSLYSGYAFATASRLNPLPIRYYTTGTTPVISNQQISISGGLAMASCGTLLAADEFKKYLRWDNLDQMFGGQVYDISGTLGIRGFYGSTIGQYYSGNQAIKFRENQKIQSTAAGLVITQKLLPGADQGVDGLNFYSRPTPSATPGDNNNDDCRPEKIQEKGWTLRASHKKEYFINGAVQIGAQAIAALNVSNSSQLSYCLTKSGIPFGSMSNAWSLSSASVNSVDIYSQNTSPVINTCYPLDLNLRATGANQMLHNPHSIIDLVVGSRYSSNSTPASTLHLMPDCSDTPTATKNISVTNFALSSRLYYSAPSVNSYEFYLASSTPSLAFGAPLSIYSISAPTSFTDIKLTYNSSLAEGNPLNELPSNSCIPVRVSTFAGGNPVDTTASISFTFRTLDDTAAYSLPTGTRLVASCANPAPISHSMSFSGVSYRDFAIEVGASPPDNFIMVATGNSIVSKTRLNITPVIHHLRPTLVSGSVPNPFEGECQEIEYQSFDATGVALPVPSGQIVEFRPQRLYTNNSNSNDFNLEFYPSSTDCNSGSNMNPNFAIPANNTSLSVWMKAYGDGLIKIGSQSQSAKVSNPNESHTASLLSLNIMPNLIFSASPGSMIVNTNHVISFTGGKAPYTVFVQSGGGVATLGSQTYPNKYLNIVAPATPGTMMIILTDSKGISRSLNITVTN